VKEGDFIYNTIDYNKKLAILAGIDYNQKNTYTFEDAMDELRELARAGNFEVVSQISQKREKKETGTYFGSGKLEELKEEIIRTGANLVIFDDELSGMQIRNLEAILEVDILDRTGLILGIFGTRAKSKEGQLQIELAQLEYEKPRLIGLGEILSRTGAGIGTRGLGESKLELDRRVISKRIVEIKKQIEEVQKNREIQRSQRVRSGIKNIALVGYTNAGKSTLLNKFIEISKSELENKAYVEDMLFATLDPFNKKIVLEDNLSFILTDTVGFVSKLPHTLVEAFKSTLEEVVLADYLIYVVDVSNEHYQYQLDVTLNVVKELGAGDIPFLVAYNKIDKLSEEELKERGDISFDFVDISAVNGLGLESLIEKIKKHISKEEVLLKLLLPYDVGNLHSQLMEKNRVMNSEYKENGIEVEVYIKNSELHKFEKYKID